MKERGRNDIESERTWKETGKKAVCGICASGCPMDVYVEDGKIISVEGSKDLLWAERRTLCKRGSCKTVHI